MLEVEHFMLNKQGMTLIETLMAFSIFISIIVLFLSCYNNAINHHCSLDSDLRAVTRGQNRMPNEVQPAPSDWFEISSLELVWDTF